MHGSARMQVRKLAGGAKAWSVVGAADITSTAGLQFGETHTPGEPFRCACLVERTRTGRHFAC